MQWHWHRQRLMIEGRFATARATRRQTETIVVALEHKGIVGLGEAVPVEHAGQTIELIEAALPRLLQLLPDEPWPVASIVDRLRQHAPAAPAALAAIDSALHDWLGKRLGVPVWRLLGLDARNIPPTSLTIGIDQPDVVAAKVRQAESFPILKLKLGAGDEQAALRTVRRYAPTKTLRVDANGGWTYPQAAERMRLAASFGVEFIEQPIPPGNTTALQRLRRLGIAPIFADESCLGPRDVLALAGCVDGINIKLAKCGGLLQARRMVELARALGMQVMLGCMIESSLGIAAAAQLAPLADYLDLDGHLLLAHDPFEGIGGAGGRLTLTNEPGLGVRQRA